MDEFLAQAQSGLELTDHIKPAYSKEIKSLTGCLSYKKIVALIIRSARGAAVFVILNNSVTLAQEAQSSSYENNVAVFDANFFAEYEPITALDIVDRVPGFRLDAGQVQRGLTGSSSNVLINGERAISKRGSVEDALRRIPASTVERIELARSAGASSETSGQSTILNVITRPDASSSTVAIELELSSEGVAYPRADFTFSDHVFGWNTSTNVNGFWEQFDLTGTRLRFDSEDELIEVVSEDRPDVFSDLIISTEWERVAFGGDLVLTSSFGFSGFFQVTDRRQRSLDNKFLEEANRVYIDIDSSTFLGEFGANWTKKVTPQFQLKLVSLANFSLLDQKTDIENLSGINQVVARTLVDLEQAPIEVIFQGTISDQQSDLFQPEVGLELVYNTLDSTLFIRSGVGSDATAPLALPASGVRVSEYRWEAFLNTSSQMTKKLSLSSRLALESSLIRVDGEVDESTELHFFKPSFSAFYDLSDHANIRFGIERSVGQLDFTDFAASVNAADERLLSGNPSLRPDTRTKAYLGLDWDSPKFAAIEIELYHEWIEDVVGQGLLPNDGVGVTNIGAATLVGVDVSATVNTGSFLPNSNLDVEVGFRKSELDERSFDRVRPLSNYTSPNGKIEFWQDFPNRKVSWGATYLLPERGERYFVDEESNFVTGGTLSAYVETTKFLKSKIRLSAFNIGYQTFPESRFFFDQNRSNPLIGSEIVARQRGTSLRIELEREF